MPSRLEELAGFADQKAELSALAGKCFSYVMADESCCAGEKNLH